MLSGSLAPEVAPIVTAMLKADMYKRCEMLLQLLRVATGMVVPYPCFLRHISAQGEVGTLFCLDLSQQMTHQHVETKTTALCPHRNTRACLPREPCWWVGPMLPEKRQGSHFSEGSKTSFWIYRDMSNVQQGVIFIQ